MTQPKRIVFFLCLLLTQLPGSSQEAISNARGIELGYPQDYFRSPVDIPIYLSGTYGEPRTTHFHAGIDIKTQQVEGKNILAIADGYVSRIKVSPYGYGRALYITHPNGFVSVYGHLKKFDDAVEEYVKDQQYLEESFYIDVYPDSTLFTFSKGDVIALSGNTGSSGGPHLHFEIRDEITEDPINPLLFGFDVKDNLNPTCLNLALYAMDESRFITEPKHFALTNYGSVLKPFTDVKAVNSSKVGIAVHTYDQLNGASNKNGIYSIKTYHNDELIYTYEMDRFHFDQSKCVHDHTDYTARKTLGRTYHKCFINIGNVLPTYEHAGSRGLIDISESGSNHIRIEVGDVHGNIRTIEFDLMHDPKASLFSSGTLYFTKILYPLDSNYYEGNGLNAAFPVGSLFDTTYFNHSTETNSKSSIYSDIHMVHDEKATAFQPFNISITPTDIPYGREEKMILAYKSSKGSISSMGGNWNGETVSTSSRLFGKYYITSDETPPAIQALNISEGKNMQWESNIRFKITDNLSGISEYNAWVDGKWILMEYDPRKAQIWYTFDGRIEQGDHELVLEVQDERGNKATYTANFKR